MKFDLDSFDEKNAFQIVEYLCNEVGPRLSGSKAEEKAVNFIKSKFEKIKKNSSTIEQYPHTYYRGSEAIVKNLDTGISFEGRPMYMSKSTLEEGIEGKGFYMGSINELEKYTKQDIEGKIVFLFLTRDYLEPEIFRQIRILFKMKPLGVIFLTTYHQDVVRSDPFFEVGCIFSFIPTMLISAVKMLKDAKNLHGGNYLLKIQGETLKGNLYNTILELKGKRRETIILCAHHDTVEYSSGARYNAAGVAVILELAKILASKELNFSYRIITFGGEEQGLDGAIHYLEKDDISNIILSLNFEGIDPLPGFIASIVAGDESLFGFIKELSDSNNYPALAINRTPTGGDNLIFVEKNIPSILHMVKGSTVYGYNHTELDSIENYHPDSIGEIGKFALRIINWIEEMDEELDFSLSIPYNIEEEVDSYFERFKDYQK